MPAMISCSTVKRHKRLTSCHLYRQDMVQQQQNSSRASSEDGRDSLHAAEAHGAELQQLKSDLLAAQTRLRDSGEQALI